jgi:hypothetical protein
LNRKKLETLRRELQDIVDHPAGTRSRDFKRYARKLGRRKVNRGKHLTYEHAREIVPGIGVRALTIPDHPGDLPKGTAGGIAIFLLNNDVAQYEQLFDESGAIEVVLPDQGEEDEEDGA